MAYKPAFHAHTAILDSFFYAYSVILNSFVIVFLEKRYIPQYYCWRTSYVCACLRQRFGQGGCYCGCDKTVCLQLHPYTTFFDTPQQWLSLETCLEIRFFGSGFRMSRSRALSLETLRELLFFLWSLARSSSLKTVLKNDFSKFSRSKQSVTKLSLL